MCHALSAAIRGDVRAAGAPTGARASGLAVVMRALEEAMTEEAGRTKRLNRTRQKLNRVGVRQTLADLALKPQPSLERVNLSIFAIFL